jgi:hypothetical protein
MKLDFTSVGKDVSGHNDLSGEENLMGAIELSDEDLAGVVGAMRRHRRHHRRHHRDEDFFFPRHDFFFPRHDFFFRDRDRFFGMGH